MSHANIQGTLGRSHRGRNDFRMGNTWRSRVRWQKVYVYQYVPTARNYAVSYWRKILRIFITDCKKLSRKLQSLKMTPSSTLLSLIYVWSFKPSKGVNRYPLSAFVRPIFRIKSFGHPKYLFYTRGRVQGGERPEKQGTGDSRKLILVAALRNEFCSFV